MQTLSPGKKVSFVKQPDDATTKMMRSLHDAIGSVVCVQYVTAGEMRVERKTLEAVEDFVGIDLHFNGRTTMRFSFVEWDAIRKITKGDELLFENPKIRQDYNPANHLRVARMQISCFGVGIAKQIRQQTNGSVVRKLPEDLYKLVRKW